MNQFFALNRQSQECHVTTQALNNSNNLWQLVEAHLQQRAVVKAVNFWCFFFFFFAMLMLICHSWSFQQRERTYLANMLHWFFCWIFSSLEGDKIKVFFKVGPPLDWPGTTDLREASGPSPGALSLNKMQDLYKDRQQMNTYGSEGKTCFCCLGETVLIVCMTMLLQWWKHTELPLVRVTGCLRWHCACSTELFFYVHHFVLFRFLISLESFFG